MLKIKDNVDLKELEKFGLKYVEHISWNGNCSYYSNQLGVITINVDCGNRYLYVNGNGDYDCSPDDIDVVFELTQAGLIEKVKRHD